MKLVWHIIGKDIRRLRWALLGWGGVILAQYGAWRLDRVAAEADHGSGMAAKLMLGLWVLHLVGAWLLVPFVVQDDALDDARAEWRTRPISRGRLLAAKLGGVAVMLWLWPSLLTAPWWIEFGFGPLETVRAVAANAAGMAALTSVALLIAVLTENLVRFLMWSTVALVMLGVGALWIVAAMPGNADAAILATRAALACVVVVATVAAVVPLRFLTRAPWLARGVAVGATMAMGLVLQYWPWSVAEMLARTGGKNQALPTVTARVSESTLILPSDPTRQRAKVQVTTRFTTTGIARGDDTVLESAEPKWRLGDVRGAALPFGFGDRVERKRLAKQLVQEKDGTGQLTNNLAWEISLPGQVATRLRNGEAVVSARNRGVVWRAELGPTAALREGAWAWRGLAQLHVTWVGQSKEHDWRYDTERDVRGVKWLQTESLVMPTVMLEVLNGIPRTERDDTAALLLNGDKASLDTYPEGARIYDHRFLPNGRIPVGVTSVKRLASKFEREYGTETDFEAGEVTMDGATLTSVTFRPAAAFTVPLAETPFVPELVVEGRLDEALRRAKAEDKPVLARVAGRGLNSTEKDASTWQFSGWSYAAEVRELLVKRFVCAQLTGAEAERLRRPTDEDGAWTMVVLQPNGEGQDRLRDLNWRELPTALRANLAGKTYAAALTEQVALNGGDDRMARYRLHEALRARGDLSGAFDAILWLAEHPSAPFEGAEVYSVAWRIEKYVATQAAAREILLERRDLALANLRRDPRDAGAARLLFTITLGLKRDETVWNEFPRLIPRENPWRWEFTRNWIADSVRKGNYGQVVQAVELERFFAEGPEWMNAQLLQRRSLVPKGPPTTATDWRRQLRRAGANCVEALAGAKQRDAALRVAAAVRQVDDSKDARAELAYAWGRGGEPALAQQLRAEGNL